MLKKPGKQYGLIKKKKPETKLVASKLSFFNDDDDEDEGLDEKKRIEKELKKTAAQKKVNKQTQVNIPPHNFLRRLLIPKLGFSRAEGAF